MCFKLCKSLTFLTIASSFFLFFWGGEGWKNIVRIPPGVWMWSCHNLCSCLFCTLIPNIDTVIAVVLLMKWWWNEEQIFANTYVKILLPQWRAHFCSFVSICTKFTQKQHMQPLWITHVCCVSPLQEFVSRSPSQTPLLLQFLLDNPVLAGLVAPHFVPNNTPQTFLSMYEQLITALQQQNLSLVFMLLTKVTGPWAGWTTLCTFLYGPTHADSKHQNDLSEAHGVDTAIVPLGGGGGGGYNLVHLFEWSDQFYVTPCLFGLFVFGCCWVLFIFFFGGEYNLVPLFDWND